MPGKAECEPLGAKQVLDTVLAVLLLWSEAHPPLLAAVKRAGGFAAWV